MDDKGWQQDCDAPVCSLAKVVANLLNAVPGSLLLGFPPQAIYFPSPKWQRAKSSSNGDIDILQ